MGQTSVAKMDSFVCIYGTTGMHILCVTPKGQRTLTMHIIILATSNAHDGIILYSGLSHVDYTPCTGKYHESVAISPRVPQARVAIRQQTSDIASTQCVLNNLFHTTALDIKIYYYPRNIALQG